MDFNFGGTIRGWLERFSFELFFVLCKLSGANVTAGSHREVTFRLTIIWSWLTATLAQLAGATQCVSNVLHAKLAKFIPGRPAIANVPAA